MQCPFTDPKFQIDPEEPCPVCGMLGTHDAEDKCIEGKPENKIINDYKITKTNA